MRTAFALVLAAVLGACGIDGSEGDDTNTPDGTPRPGPGFVLESPPIELLPTQEITLCWYFRTPNTKPLAIKKWKSSMTPGSHHMILYTTATDRMPPGTQNAIDCAAGGLSSTWTYSAQTPEAVVEMPADDGEGKPVAMELGANQPGFLQMHYYNTTDEPLLISVKVEAEALEEGVAYTKTAAYVTYNSQINIPPMTTNDVEAQTCNVPTESKFWLISTHAHKQAAYTRVKDGMPSTGAMVFESDDWDHPGAVRWNEAPFHTFETGKLTYECQYNNPTSRTIKTGESAQTDEMCMASGYFFPAARPVFCFDGFSI